MAGTRYRGEVSFMADPAHDAYDAERAEVALTQAAHAAQEIAATFNREHEGSELHPTLRSDLTAGGDEQPLFVFSLVIALDEDFDADDYPSAVVEEFVSDARRRVEASPVDEWSWLVSVNVGDAPDGD